jgi:hypothetical protein
MGKSFTQIVEMCHGERIDAWSQASMLALFRIPEGQFSGMCLALCAVFLGNSQHYLEERRKTSFKIDTLNMFRRYEAKQASQSTPGDEWICNDYFGFQWTTRGDVKTFAEAGWPATYTKEDGRYLISLLKEGGGGHAMAIVVQSGKQIYSGIAHKFLFFDPNDGIAGFGTWEQLNSAVAHHLNDSYVPLNYSKYWVTRWSY